MTESQRAHLRTQLVDAEDLVLHAYQDTFGYWTIGVGRLIDSRRGGGISVPEAFHLLDNDIDTCLDDLRSLPWFDRLDPVRQNVVLDMRFNLGPSGIRGFRRMIAALDRGDVAGAADEMKASAWYGQVGRRGPKLERMMRSGAGPGGVMRTA